MVGLRQKLILGFGGLLLIMLVVSGLSIYVTIRDHRVFDTFISENYRSVVYGQKMVDGIDSLTDAVKDNKPLPQAAIDAFDANLIAEDNNITLHPKEDELATALTDLWAGVKAIPAPTQAGLEHSRGGLRYALSHSPTHEELIARLTQDGQKAKSLSRDIINLNLDNMQPANERVKSMTGHAGMWMLALTAAGIGLAALFIVVVSRSILRPVQALTRSAREIEQGNLDLVVQVHSRDELHQLAEAFNTMAAKLREYRRTNRAQLVRTQQSTQNAINSLPDAVAIVSPDGTVEMANTASQRLFGLRPDAHVSELHVKWLSDLFDRVTRDLRPIEPRGYDSAIQVLDESGGERFFLPHAVPVLDADRSLLGVTVALADVTNLRRLDEMKNGMLSVVSHELKTPLTSIRMGVHLLLEERLGALSPEQNDILVAMREDSDRLGTIVDNLLDMGRIESGRGLMELKPEPAARVATEGSQPLLAAFRDKGVELLVEVPADTPPVMVDQTRIGHVFSNLLGNALKYTPPGGGVRVTAIEEGEFVKFSVTDSGVGIPRQFLARIFERFFRVPGQAGGTGAGLGLAIAREIVVAHGGSISVQSTPGAGSNFIFTLQRADSPRQPAPDSAAPAKVLPPPAKGLPPATKEVVTS